MEYLYFKTHKKFYDWLISNGVELDISPTCRLSRYSVSISGEIHFNSKLSDMLVTLNKYLPSGKQLNTKTSTIKGSVGYLLYFKEVGDTKVELEEVLAEKVQSKEGTLTEDLTFDLEYALSLQEGKPKKDAKDALEIYGRKFNVELAKNKKFEDMIEDLKDLLSK